MSKHLVRASLACLFLLAVAAAPAAHAAPAQAGEAPLSGISLWAWAADLWEASTAWQPLSAAYQKERASIDPWGQPVQGPARGAHGWARGAISSVHEKEGASSDPFGQPLQAAGYRAPGAGLQDGWGGADKVGATINPDGAAAPPAAAGESGEGGHLLDPNG